jgi:hypothetical protein
MKAKDLMIGDWVLHHNSGCIDAMNDTAPYDEAIRIEQSDFELDECFWSRLDPIPITPEILEKNGFKKARFNDNEPSGLCGKWWSKDGLILVKMFELTLMGIVFSVSGSNSRISNIRYVHELQHALRLCGIDKEIEL